jgi:hypothetical protein
MQTDALSDQSGDTKMLQVWCYTGSDGGAHYGVFQGFSNQGGTDVTYRFHRLGKDGLPITFDNGGMRLDCVSGSSLKAARRVGTTPESKPWFAHSAVRS